MSLMRFIVVFCLTALLSACGLFEGKDELAYKNAESAGPLEIPEGLKEPRELNQFDIPPADSNAPADPAELEEPPQIVKSGDLAELESEEAEKTGTEGEKGAAQPAQPPEGVTSKLTRNTEGASVLLVDAGFDRVWSLVEPALKELGFTIEDSSRGAQIVTVSKLLPEVRFEEDAPHPADEEPDVKEEYQIHLETADDKTRITVHNKFGTLESSGLSEHLLLQISEIMKNPKAQSG